MRCRIQSAQTSVRPAAIPRSLRRAPLGWSSSIPLPQWRARVLIPLRHLVPQPLLIARQQVPNQLEARSSTAGRLEPVVRLRRAPGRVDPFGPGHRLWSAVASVRLGRALGRVNLQKGQEWRERLAQVSGQVWSQSAGLAWPGYQPRQPFLASGRAHHQGHPSNVLASRALSRPFRVLDFLLNLLEALLFLEVLVGHEADL